MSGLTELLEIVENLRSYSPDTRWGAMRLCAADEIDLLLLVNLASIYEGVGQCKD